MRKTAVIVLKLGNDLPDIEADYIGADKGALVLAEKNIRMRLAVGDFDSVSKEEFTKIAEYADEVIRLNPVKDDSDSESALNHVLAMGYEEVWLAGATGGRMDHSYVNLRLAAKHPGRVILYDDQNRICCHGQGTYEYDDSYTYVSFFAMPEAVISLRGFRYELERRHIDENDIYTLSNEVVSGRGIMTVHEGMVMVMESRDRGE